MRVVAGTAATSILAAGIVLAENKSYCSWDGPRGGVVRNALYIEGGLLMTGVWLDGEFPKCESVSSSQGVLYRLDFNKSFDVSKDDPTTLLLPLQETLDGTAPVYIGGTMFADDDEWYSFGGRAYSTNTNPSSDSPITWNGLYQPNSLATKAPMGIRTDYPFSGTNGTEYVTNGAGTSVSSESQGFYFSGYRSENSSELSYYGSKPTKLVTTMLQVDTSSFNNPTWSELALPSEIHPRADAAMVWIPVGAHGALAIIGGVTIPAGLFGDPTLNATAESNVNTTGPDFISQIPVYDIGLQKWYLQQTSGSSPPVTAQACVVRASPLDGSSHQIFMYGGYDGTYASRPYDTMWVLSLPAFRWVLVNAGNTIHGRSSHICATPYPNKMIMLGGVQQYGSGAALTTDKFLDVFDLNSLTWTGKYDASETDTVYQVPSVVADAISGTNAWGAGMDAGLANLFKQPYQGTITHFYPYVNESSSAVKSLATAKHAWLIPVIVVVIVLVLATTAASVWCFCWRKRGQPREDGTHAGAAQSRSRVIQWLRNPSPNSLPPKSLVSDETTEIGEAMSPTIATGPHEAFGDSYFKPKPAEMEGVTTPTSNGISPPISGMTSPGSIQTARNRAQVSHELDGRPPVTIRDHPMFPFNITGARAPAGVKATTSLSEMDSAGSPLVSSNQSTGQMSPYELPETRGTVPKDDLDLNQAASSMASQTISGSTIDQLSVPSPDLQATNVLFSLGTQKITPAANSGGATQTTIGEPRTPDQPGHVRNNSSLSTTLTQLSPMSAGEEQRRSAILHGLPEKPAAQQSQQPQQQQQPPSPPPNRNLAIAESAVSGVSALTPAETQGSTTSPIEVSPIQRRPSTTAGGPSLRQSRQIRSAYGENVSRLDSEGITLPNVQLGKDGWGGGTL